ncbi:MAG: cyclopropane-fatty-acyl-phospholipid synthase family protein [Cellvibrionaceae bacterium]
MTSVNSQASSTANYSLEISQQSFTFMDKIAYRFISQALRKLEIGQLTLSFEGNTLFFGNPQHELSAHIEVTDKAFFKHVMLHRSIGLGEAYMDNLWDTPDLTNLIQVMAANLKAINDLDKNKVWYSKILSRFAHRLNRNTLSGSKKNIEAHYDLSNDFFELFLDSTMLYSAAIFGNASDSLKIASMNKAKTICQKLQLTKDDHLLEIGTGWGYLAIHAAMFYGCKVTTTTLSEEQYAYAKAKVAELGLSDKITLLKTDYRELTGEYDKLVSIEMIEAVGHEYYDTYFEKCDSLLKDDGLMLIQAITIEDQRYEHAKNSVDFIQKYIFPGGGLPSNAVIMDCLARKTQMQMVGFQDIGMDYAKTLNHWKKNFLQKKSEVMKLGFDERFIRMWEYYLCYCEGGFLQRAISTGQFVFAKSQWQPKNVS